MAVLADIAEITRQAANIAGAITEYKISDKCRRIESGVTKAVFGLGLLKVAALIFAGGAGFLLWGSYKLLAFKMSPPASAVTLGATVMVIGLLLCWWAAKTK